MSSRPQRRTSRDSSGSNRTFYIILAATLLVGVAAIAAIIINSQSGRTISTPATASNTQPTVNPADLPTLTLGDFVAKGEANAPVTVVEYADYQCPACGYFAQNIAPEIDREFVQTGKVRFVFHEYPLPQHRNAVPAAEAARCANDQGAFWKMHDVLFQNQMDWSNSGNPTRLFGEYAGGLGLDRAKFDSCLSAGTHRNAILAAQARADQVGVSSTPTFEVNGQKYNMDQVKQAIQTALGGQ
jgi:protein-disulfide isomerase